MTKGSNEPAASGRLAGKVALVTGASRGIGRAMAQRFAAEGALVAVHYGHDEAAAKVTVESIEKAGGKAFMLRAELSLPKEIAELYKNLEREVSKRTGQPKFDILVNNAATDTHTNLEAITEEQYDLTMAVNVKGPIFMAKLGLAHMRDGGRIINISSGASHLAYPESLAYAVSKGAINTFSLALAKQVGPRQITVNTLAPGMTVTDMSAPLLSPEVTKFFSDSAALGRLGKPEDIAAAAMFLASDDGRWVTGTFVSATGGLLI